MIIRILVAMMILFGLTDQSIFANDSNVIDVTVSESIQLVRENNSEHLVSKNELPLTVENNSNTSIRIDCISLKTDWDVLSNDIGNDYFKKLDKNTQQLTLQLGYTVNHEILFHDFVDGDFTSDQNLEIIKGESRSYQIEGMLGLWDTTLNQFHVADLVITISSALYGDVVIDNMSPNTGDTLTVTLLDSPMYADYTYQWYRSKDNNLQMIENANLPSYTIHQDDLGYQLKCVVIDQSNLYYGSIESEFTQSVQYLEPLIKVWSSSSDSDFHTNAYKNSLTHIVFENSIPDLSHIADDKKWDVSNAQNGSVIAYVTDHDTRLHIAGNGGVYANINSSYLFSGFTNLISIDMTHFIFDARVKNTSYMFSNCSKIESIDMSNFNMGSVNYTQFMFSNCISLTSINFSSAKTYGLVNINAMFQNCKSLVTLDLSKLTTNNVTMMQYVFYGCTNLKSINLNNFVTKQVTDMNSLFSGCSSLTELNLRSFEVTKLRNANNMFYNCSSLVTIYAKDWYNLNSSVNGTNMFSGCTSLKGKISYSANRLDWNMAKNSTIGYLTP